MLKQEIPFILGCLVALFLAYLLVSTWDADTDTRLACAHAYPDKGKKPPAGSICEFYWKRRGEMSLDTWMQEFYPVRAEHAKDVLEHSIQKWTGLLPENLEKHEVSVQYYAPGKLRVLEKDEQGFFLWIDSSTCALCMQHLKDSGYCDFCPLFRVLGMRCDANDWEKSPWRQFVRYKVAQPMLDLLLQAKEREGK